MPQEETPIEGQENPCQKYSYIFPHQIREGAEIWVLNSEGERLLFRGAEEPGCVSLEYCSDSGKHEQWAGDGWYQRGGFSVGSPIISPQGVEISPEIVEIQGKNIQENILIPEVYKLIDAFLPRELKDLLRRESLDDLIVQVTVAIINLFRKIQKDEISVFPEQTLREINNVLIVFLNEGIKDYRGEVKTESKRFFVGIPGGSRAYQISYTVFVRDGKAIRFSIKPIPITDGACKK